MKVWDVTKATNELIIEILRKIQGDVADMKGSIRDVKSEIISIRNQLHIMQGDNLRQEQVIAGVHLDVDRIKTRLDLSDA